MTCFKCFSVFAICNLRRTVSRELHEYIATYAILTQYMRQIERRTQTPIRFRTQNRFEDQPMCMRIYIHSLLERDYAVRAAIRINLAAGSARAQFRPEPACTPLQTPSAAVSRVRSNTIGGGAVLSVDSLVVIPTGGSCWRRGEYTKTTTAFTLTHARHCAIYYTI